MELLSGHRRGILLAGVLLLAYMVIFFSWLTGIRLPNVPARTLPLTLLVTLRNWLVGMRWPIIPAGVLLLALMVASAGSTLGDSGIHLVATSSHSSATTETIVVNEESRQRLKLIVAQGQTVTYTVNFNESPVGLIYGYDSKEVKCGDVLSVHLFSGHFLTYLEIEPHGFTYYTDGNNDDNCDDGVWGSYWGNTATVTVAADAPNNAIVSLSYEVEKNFRRVISPRTLVHMRVTDVVPPTPTPAPTPTPKPTPTPETNTHAKTHDYTYAYAYSRVFHAGNSS